MQLQKSLRAEAKNFVHSPSKTSREKDQRYSSWNESIIGQSGRDTDFRGAIFVGNCFTLGHRSGREFEDMWIASRRYKEFATKNDEGGFRSKQYNEELQDWIDSYTADITNADLRSLDISAIDSSEKLLFTNLSQSDVRQDQLDSAVGDNGTLIPDHLTRPEHWETIQLPPEHPNYAKKAKSLTSIEETKNFPKLTGEVVAQNLTSQSTAISLSITSFLAQLSILRSEIRQSNSFASENLELRDGLLEFLDTLENQLLEFSSALPSQGKQASNEQIELASTWINRFQSTALPGFQKYLSPEALGDITPPAAIIISFGSIGAALTGFNPLGFGVGSMIGRWLTRELKSGAAAKEFEKLSTETQIDSE